MHSFIAPLQNISRLRTQWKSVFFRFSDSKSSVATILNIFSSHPWSLVVTSLLLPVATGVDDESADMSGRGIVHVQSISSPDTPEPPDPPPEPPDPPPEPPEPFPDPPVAENIQMLIWRRKRNFTLCYGQSCYSVFPLLDGVRHL